MIFNLSMASALRAMFACLILLVAAGSYGQALASVAVTPNPVLGGDSCTGTVTIGPAAPAGGFVVTLTSQIPAYVTVPASITVAAGATTANFSVTTAPFRLNYTVAIKASHGASSKSTSLVVTKNPIGNLTASPNPVQSGLASTGTITLYTNAPTGGAVITLTSENPSYVSVPASVTIPAGQNQGTFPITTQAFRSNFTNTITASYGGSNYSTTLSLTGVTVTGLTFTTNPILGGDSTTGTVTISAAAGPSGAVVTFTSQIPGYVPAPTSITIPSGSTTGTFTVTTNAFHTVYTDVITAFYANSYKQGTLSIQPNTVSGLSLAPTTVTGGNSSTGTVSITTAAPTGGAIVTLTSQFPTYVGVPATVTIPAGTNSTTFTVTTNPFRQNYTNKITAKYADSYRSVVISVITGLGVSDWPKFRNSPTNAGVGLGSGAKGVLDWSYATGGNVVSAPCIGPDGTVYIGSDDFNVYAFNGDTGALKWKTATGARVGSSPAIGGGGTLYVGSDDYNVYALDSTTGAVIWKYKTGNWVESSPTIGFDGTVYVGSDDGFLYALDGPTGTLKWKFTAPGFVESSPAINTDGTIFVGGGNNVYALDGATGAIKWTYATGGEVYSSPALSYTSVVYVGSGDGYLYAIDAKFGTLEWKYKTGDGIYASPAVSSSGIVYIGSYDDSLYALNATTGALVWSYATGDYIDSSPAIGSDGTVYLGGNDNFVYALNGTTGALNWSYETGDYIGSSPAISSAGIIYIGSADQNVYAIK